MSPKNCGVKTDQLRNFVVFVRVEMSSKNCGNKTRDDVVAEDRLIVEMDLRNCQPWRSKVGIVLFLQASRRAQVARRRIQCSRRQIAVENAAGVAPLPYRRQEDIPLDHGRMNARPAPRPQRLRSKIKAWTGFALPRL